MLMESATETTPDTAPVITVRRPVSEEVMTDQRDVVIPPVPFVTAGLGNLGA